MKYGSLPANVNKLLTKPQKAIFVPPHYIKSPFKQGGFFVAFYNGQGLNLFT
jgi:hypothetical protein